jgi:hypothetical protein
VLQEHGRVIVIAGRLHLPGASHRLDAGKPDAVAWPDAAPVNRRLAIGPILGIQPRQLYARCADGGCLQR